MKLKQVPLLIILSSIVNSSYGMPYDQTNCVDVKVSSKVNYTTCRHYDDPRKELYSDYYKANQITHEIRSTIKKQFERQWQPPMGYSGYMFSIHYGLDTNGNLNFLELGQNGFSDEIKEEILQTFSDLAPFKVTKDQDAQEILKRNTIQIRIK